MYNPQMVAERIKEEAKKQKISIKDVLIKSELSINTISLISKGREISFVSFSKIADCLNCSVDYLLGRTDNPEVNKTAYNVTNANNSAFGTGSSVNINNASALENDDVVGKTFQIFSNLSLQSQLAVLNFIVKLSEEEEQ